jgi:hypothetical protein
MKRASTTYLYTSTINTISANCKQPSALLLAPSALQADHISKDCSMGDLQEPIPDSTVSLPVIDLSLGRDELSRAVLHAGKNIGFFQASPNILSVTPVCMRIN